MPVTNATSEWFSGNLVFFEKSVGHSTTGDILEIGTSIVQVGDTAQDVDFKVQMGATNHLTCDTGAGTITMVATTVAITADITLTGDLTLDGEDLRINDGDSLEFGDAADVTMSWDGSALDILPLANDTGAINIGDGTTDIDFKWFGGTVDARSAYAELDVSASNFETQNLQHKIHVHDTTRTYAVEVKYDYWAATGLAFGIDCTCEIEPGGGTPASRTSGGLRALQGVARVGSGFTITGGGDIGVYGQFCNNGTINGASTYPSAGYFLIEDGGTWTQVGVGQVLWLDSHLAQTVSAGDMYFLNITNNAATTVWDAAVHVYGGNNITNFATIDTASGMVSGNTVGDATFANWKTIKVELDGTTHYLIAAQSITG